MTTTYVARILRQTDKGCLIGSDDGRVWLPRRAVTIGPTSGTVSVADWAVDLKAREGVDLSRLFGQVNGQGAGKAIAVKAQAPELEILVERMKHIERTLDRLGTAIVELVTVLRDKPRDQPEVKPEVKPEVRPTTPEPEPDSEPAGNILDAMLTDLRNGAPSFPSPTEPVKPPADSPANPLAAMLAAMKVQQDSKRKGGRR